MQAAPGVYAIRAVGCTVYLLGGIELTLIDAGGPGSAPRILHTVKQLDHHPQDLTRILLTHVELDHVGALADLIAATGAHVFAHPAALRRLAIGQAPRGGHGFSSFWAAVRRLFSPLRPVAHAEPLADGMELGILGGLQVIFTGGHSPDHTVFFARTSRLVLSGDLLRVVSGHLQAQPGPETRERAETVLALRRLATLDPLAILPSHGPAFRDNIPLRLVRQAEILE